LTPLIKGKDNIAVVNRGKYGNIRYDMAAIKRDKHSKIKDNYEQRQI